MEISRKENILGLWLAWQFYEMPKFLVHAWTNYFLFAVNYFSFTLLVKTLLSPWRRYRWAYPRGLNIGEFLSTLVSNIFSRIIGAVIRLVLIVIGLLFQVFVATGGVVVIVVWILLPFIIVFGFLFILTY